MDPLQAHQLARDCSMRFNELNNNLSSNSIITPSRSDNTGSSVSNNKKPMKDEENDDFFGEGGDEFDFKPDDFKKGSGIDFGAESAPRYEDNPWGFGPWRDVSRYMIMNDVNIPDDPYYMVRYRSFHNHELDLNLLAHIGLVNEKDIWRKGAWRTLPQGIVAIQGLMSKRKLEIIERQLKQSSKTLSFEDCKKRFERLQRDQ
jgi:hypothetical protein